MPDPGCHCELTPGVAADPRLNERMIAPSPPRVMPTEVGIHDYRCGGVIKPWMPTSVGMTRGQCDPRLDESAGRHAHLVIAGLEPAIYAQLTGHNCPALGCLCVDGRHKAGHDGYFPATTGTFLLAQRSTPLEGSHVTRGRLLRRAHNDKLAEGNGAP